MKNRIYIFVIYFIKKIFQNKVILISIKKKKNVFKILLLQISELAIFV